MKLGTALIDGRNTLIAKVGDGAATLEALYRHAGLGAAPASLNDFIEAGKPELGRAAQALAKAEGVGPLDPAGLDWLPPQPRPSKIIGVAFNNMGIRKSAHKDPGVPNFFFKAPSSLLGHGKAIVMKQHYGETIPELELACVIGRRAKDLGDAEAGAAIFGYTIVNDVTSHGMKFGMDSIATTREPHLMRDHHLAWRNRHGPDDNDVYFVYHARSKATDTFGPMGPWITTADEVADPNNLKVEGWLDGEPFAIDSTASYRFKIEQVVAEASRYFTLEPGDVICCGTSAKGVGKYPDGHRSVNMHKLAGTMDIEIEGLGRLTSTIRHDWKD